MHVNVRAIIERESAAGTEIVIQRRVKSNEDQKPFELPGGRINPFESYVSALKREVFEETGLRVNKIYGAETRMETNDHNSNVEILKPFAIYQTVDGPVDSLGAYFRCEAQGTLLHQGDETDNIMWISVNELISSLDNQEIDFSWVDKSGILYYLRWFKEQQAVDSIEDN
ncbi:NUDIX hydrolase [Gracilibacillus alcaliphilus]|uniref:NUDIX hydrolase n=1 Tax=Gracilibacillus alcaliphilus TaxID=1401441 RepID=UPI001957EC6E|nr:NUDIX hydrolase [Gracilibacillus alcaliphilus]MBM7677847.1 8-oxo-dGTP pyrophosphatase MutT (NUDIX family) [Gracilibacillus alcaliphilus]